MLFLLSTLAGIALAQSSSASMSASMTGSASGSTQTVMVGADEMLKFTPNELTASPGDMIEFVFVDTDHTVAQAAFDKPCAPMGDTAFFSGGGFEMNGRWILTVNSTDPIYFYCSVGMHCQNGMVGVINASPSGSEQGFAMAAANVATNQSPMVVQGGMKAAPSSGGSDSMSSSSSAAEPSETMMMMGTTTMGGAAAMMTPFVGAVVGVAAGLAWM